ncbi:hypothetical protein [Nostoc sp.]|uniref:hypothetical protein n=1 Tax=Nostoc sp. TaxID=1180 RepID=UPI002FF8E625
MVQTIEIQKFNVHYNVGRSLDNPAAIQRRLDHIAGQMLGQTLENQLTQLNDTDNALYFIEQLNFDLPLDLTHSDDRQLATTWAGALYASIQRTLSQSGMGIVCFRDRSTFIASFLEDMMHGQAWDCWYYAEFADLRSLSAGQAVLQVLTLDGDIGRDTLLELTRRDSLERLLTRLTDAEVGAIATQCLLPPGSNVMLPNVCQTWVVALRNLLTRMPTVLNGTPAHGLIRLYTHVVRQHPELGPDVNLARFIWDLLALRQTVQQMTDRATFLHQLADARWTIALNRLERGAGRQWLTRLQPELTGVEVVGLLHDLQVDAPTTPTQRIRTAFGGVFLLVGAIADLDLYTFLQTCPYPEPQGIPKANLLLWLMVLQCLGQENLGRAWGDRGVLAFTGLTQAPGREWLADYGLRLTAEMHRAFVENLQAHCQRVIRQPDRFEYLRSFSSLPKPSEWLSLHSAPDSPLPDELWDNTLRVMSAIALQGFAARLGALSGSSPSYLSRNFLESEAEIWVSEKTITIHFLTCPLQMVLKMAGFEHFRWSIPWLGGGVASPLENRQLVLNFDG